MNCGRWPRQALLCLGAVIFSLVMAEVAARWFLPPPTRPSGAHPSIHAPNLYALRSMNQPDPRIGWVLSSDPVKVPHRLVDNHGVVQFDVVYSVAGGQRMTSAHPHTGPTLIVTGCSFTFGHGLNDQDTWPWLLQEQLPDYHVVNVADVAYGTDQALMAAEREVLASPHQTAGVVLGFGAFQIYRNSGTQGWLASVYPYSKPLFTVNGGRAEYERQVRYWSLGALSDHSDFFADLTYVLANRVYRTPRHQQANELTAALITTFARRFQALGVRLAVVLLPYGDDQSAQVKADQAFLIERLQAAQIPTLVLDFPRLPNGSIDGTKFLLPADGHPNRQYTLVVTDQLQRFLIDQKIVVR